MKKKRDKSLPAPSGGWELAPPENPENPQEEGAPEEAVPESRPAPPLGAEILEEKDERIRSLEEQLKRMQADFENYKKRKDEEWESYRKYASEKLLLELVGIQDNLERALKAAQETKNQKALVEGLQLVLRQINSTLHKENIRDIPAVGCLFDPCLHQCVQRDEAEDVPDETIVTEFQKGYTMGDRILRPSLVKVSRRPSPSVENSL